MGRFIGATLPFPGSLILRAGWNVHAQGLQLTDRSSESTLKSIQVETKAQTVEQKYPSFPWVFRNSTGTGLAIAPAVNRAGLKDSLPLFTRHLPGDATHVPGGLR